MVKNQNQRGISTRLLRKGALIEETYAAFQSWDLAMSTLLTTMVSLSITSQKP